MTSPSKNSPARAVADTGSGTVLATVEIAAPPERVFKALTTPEEIVRWWGSDTMYRTTEWVQDLRVGGRWKATGKGADGSPFTVEGEFLEIDPPRRLVQSWKPEWDGGHVTRLTYRLEAIERGTRVTVRHEGFGDRADSCRSHAEGWVAVLDWLAGFHAPAAVGGEDRYFLCRLIAPRPDFAQTMSPAEQALMGEHMAYWMGFFNAGNVLIFGPVADPKGFWGLGIFKARDEAEVRAFQAGDPAIKANVGFSSELLPLARAIVRG
ncbi:MAG TPA: SRPBCC domain-containing protein [Polyangiales bacterium]|nr:SRPBCC domain-containing protein [Polyangiales bacterium]